MSLSDLLGIGRSALLAQQRALTVTAHNLANAQTPGYSRRSLTLRASASYGQGGGWYGSGVTDEGTVRIRDQFLDAAYRRQASSFGGASVLKDHLAQIESAVGEPSDAGVAEALDTFFQSFADLANAPDSDASRQTVAAASRQLISRLHDLDASITDASAQAAERLRAGVTETNDLTRRIAAFNAQIVSAGGSGEGAPDLEDQRDLLIDRLAELMPIQVQERDDGSSDITAAGQTLVQGASATEITVAGREGGGYSLAIGSGVAITPESGALSALTTLSNETIPGFREKLDLFARTLVEQVNAIHRDGTTGSGRTQSDFFDPQGVTAGTIALASGVASSIDEIATGATGEPGDNSTAIRIGGLGSAPIESLGGSTIRGLYQEFVSTVATASNNAETDLEARQTMVESTDGERMNVSGVSVDEETIRLVSQQEAFSAAARLVQVASEMIDQILSI